METFLREYGDKENGFYTEKYLVKNKKGELIIKYIQYIDFKKVSLTRYEAYMNDGELETFGDPIYYKVYTNN